jgi:hypothetical protein
MNPFRWLVGLALAWAPVLFAATWQGTVFHDANGNGRRDPGEAGVADVAVSNGAVIGRTDAAGRYTLEGEGEGFLFVVKPRNWRVPVDALQLPRFYRRLPATSSELRALSSQLLAPSSELAASSFDFPLTPAAEPDRFGALVFADTQVGSEKEIGYFQRTIVEPLADGRSKMGDGSEVGLPRRGDRDIGSAVGRVPSPGDNPGRASGPALPNNQQPITNYAEGVAFGVTLGDVVNDKPELYDALNAAIARIGVPWYPLIGNHDLDLGALQDRGSAATFEAKYGPSTFAFQYGPVLFVALNNIRYQGGLRYLGGLTDGQFGFIQQLLAGTPRDTLVVVMMHIPWFYNDPANNETFRLADRTRLFGLLEGRPNLLFLSGHSHYQRHVFYGAAEGWKGPQPLHEYNVAAVSGGFWGGPPDANGIPIATQWDGTPHGYAILTFDGTKPPQMDYQAARPAPSDPALSLSNGQIGLWGPAVVALKQSYVSFYANVYNGHEGWKIEARVDDRVFNPMRKVVDWDPAYAAQYLAQDAGPNPAPSPRLPDPLVNYHLWRAYLPADLAAGPHTIEVRATDPAGKVYSAKRSVTIR